MFLLINLGNGTFECRYNFTRFEVAKFSYRDTSHSILRPMANPTRRPSAIIIIYPMTWNMCSSLSISVSCSVFIDRCRYQLAVSVDAPRLALPYLAHFGCGRVHLTIRIHPPLHHLFYPPTYAA